MLITALMFQSLNSYAGVDLNAVLFCPVRLRVARRVGSPREVLS
jgi:hypothetical protein